MGCSGYDDSALWKKVDEAQKQLEELSASLTQLEGQIALLTAAKTGGVITDIKENPDGGVTVTYTTADGNTATASPPRQTFQRSTSSARKKRTVSSTGPLPSRERPPS